MSSPSTDEEFVGRHWRLAIWVARRRAAQAGWRGDPDEVESDAVLGLWNAARTWRADGGTTEAAWIRRHVENAITDGLRARHGRVGYYGNAAFNSDALSLDEAIRGRALGWPDSGARRGDLIPDPVDRTALSISRVDVARAIASLDHRQRLAVHAYYWDGISLIDIGRALGVTEGRASQILTAARQRLHDELTGTKPPLKVRAVRHRPRVKHPPATCAHCGGTFRTHRRDTRYCSNEHRQAAHRARQLSASGPHLRIQRWWGPRVRSAGSASWGGACTPRWSPRRLVGRARLGALVVEAHPRRPGTAPRVGVG